VQDETANPSAANTPNRPVNKMDMAGVSESSRDDRPTQSNRRPAHRRAVVSVNECAGSGGSREIAAGTAASEPIRSSSRV
jgi:hypothetical protein